MQLDRIAFGTMNAFGTFNGLYRHTVPDKHTRALMSAVYELGIRILDTAPIYCRGFAEERIGALVGGDCEIWTKVGVSISSPIPQIDFSFDALLVGFQDSLNRLCRESVAITFLHNPDSFPKRAIEVDRFAKWAKATGKSQRIGISVLGSQIPKKLLQCDELEVVMVEYAHLPALISRHRDWLERRKVVVRSIFSGGAALKKVSRQNRSEYIDQVFNTIDDLWPVWRYVIAPRTFNQVQDYRLVVKDDFVG